ncbi:MAG: DUF4126 domain-containing protein [Acidobacteriaceae bacterium]
MILSFVMMGMTVGLRTMTAMAVLCWCAWLAFLPQHGWAFWVGSLVSVIVFTIAAVGEWVVDTLPSTPSRTSAGPLAARIVFGALVGALSAHAVIEPAAGGAIFGVIGALIGTYGGHGVRMYWSKSLGKDLPVALMESGVTLMLAVFGAWELHQTLKSALSFLHKTP